MKTKNEVELLSIRLIDHFYDDLVEERRQILIYGLTILLTTGGAYLLLSFFSLVLGVFKLAIILAVNVSILRTISGGVHSSSFKKCALVGGIIFTFLALLIKHFGVLINLNLYLWIIFLGGTLIIYFYAPADVEEKRITDLSKQFKFKEYSYLLFNSLILIYYILILSTDQHNLVVAGLTGITWQLFTITPLAYRLFTSLSL
ncbi:MAG: accessory gene regulator ArgB-like protein [Bacillota bacterium]